MSCVLRTVTIPFLFLTLLLQKNARALYVLVISHPSLHFLFFILRLHLTCMVCLSIMYPSLCATVSHLSTCARVAPWLRIGQAWWWTTVALQSSIVRRRHGSGPEATMATTPSRANACARFTSYAIPVRFRASWQVENIAKSTIGKYLVTTV